MITPGSQVRNWWFSWFYIKLLFGQNNLMTIFISHVSLFFWCFIDQRINQLIEKLIGGFVNNENNLNLKTQSGDKQCDAVHHIVKMMMMIMSASVCSFYTCVFLYLHLHRQWLHPGVGGSAYRNGQLVALHPHCVFVLHS